MENNPFYGEKNRPYYSLLAGRSSLRLAGVGGMRKKNTWFEDLKFPTKPVENLLFYLHRVSVGDYLPGKGSRPPK